MIKLKIGRSGPDTHIDGDDGALQASPGNNVEAPVNDEGRDGSDQERALGDSGDQDAKQRASQQEHGDSTDFDSTAKGASGHRDGAPDEAARRGKDTHHGISLDEEAKERLTSEGGPAPGAHRDAPLRHRHGGGHSTRHHR